MSAIGEAGGTKPVNQSITYTDREKQDVSFPGPQSAGGLRRRDDTGGLPGPVEVTMDGCQDFVSVDLGTLTCNPRGEFWRCGQPFTMCALISGWPWPCCFRRWTKREGASRGMKTVTVPVHHCPACRNVLVRGIRFILPEDLNVSGTPGKALHPQPPGAPLQPLCGLRFPMLQCHGDLQAVKMQSCDLTEA